MGTPIPHNRARFSLDAIAKATGGAVKTRGSLGDGDDIVGVSTDTRVLERGAAFVALVGSSFDGHQHLEAAEMAGAKVAIVERGVERAAASNTKLAIIEVKSTLDALGALGHAHLERWRTLEDGVRRKVVAITGSAGKTTTRIALSALLEQLFPGEVHATYGNLNNRIGVPMILLGAEPEHRIVVVELGTNEPGEIERLAAMTKPDVGILTLIAAAHSEKLGSLDGVAREKTALYRALPSDGCAIGNGDDARVLAALKDTRTGTRIAFGFGQGRGEASAYYRIVAREIEGTRRAKLSVTRGGALDDFTTPLLGEAGALASTAALATAEHLLGERLVGATISDALAHAEVGAGAGRLVPRVLDGGVTIIDDSYNANPASMAASIRAAAEIARAMHQRLILVLGEMRELGAEARPGHEAVGHAAAESGAAELVAVMGDARLIAESAQARGLAKVAFASDIAEATSRVLAIVRSGDLVLVKGSRGVATERVVRALVAAHDRSDLTPGPLAGVHS